MVCGPWSVTIDSHVQYISFLFYTIVKLTQYITSFIIGKNFSMPTHRPSNFSMQLRRKSIKDTLPGHCHISNFDSDFFLRERGFINPSPTRRLIAKNWGNSSPYLAQSDFNPHYLPNI